MFDFIPNPTIASPSRPPSLEFSSSITCCTILNKILIVIDVRIMNMAEMIVMIVMRTMMMIDVEVTSVLSRLCVAWTPLGKCFT